MWVMYKSMKEFNRKLKKITLHYTMIIVCLADEYWIHVKFQLYIEEEIYCVVITINLKAVQMPLP